MTPTIPYDQFLKNKVRLAASNGFSIGVDEINPRLKPHNKLMVKWLVENGRAACFANFGLHKTVTQLETVLCTLRELGKAGRLTSGKGLIVCPLGVRAEFINDARDILGWNKLPKFIRCLSEIEDDNDIYLTNYETIRDGKIDPRYFDVVSLDEASILRGFGGSKTFREFMRLFTGDAGPNGNRRGVQCVMYRFVATATPSPNDYIELLAYADFLGVMDVSQAKTRFFKRDSTKADNLTLLESKEEEFWLWVASWALFVTKPSDLTGNPADDEGYILPELDLRWHELTSNHEDTGTEKSGQGLLFRSLALGLQGASKEKRESLPARIKKVLELRLEDLSAHRVIWHDLESERESLEKSIPSIKTVFGNQPLELREQIVSDFSNGLIPEIGGKPSMLGSGTNLQKYCSWAIYMGIGFKFNEFIQSIHRLLRFLQKNQVRVDLIYTEAEREVRRTLERKWKQHNKLVQKMIDIVKKFGLSQAAMAQQLTRKMGIERKEIRTDKFAIFQNDNVPETKNIETNSVGLILTSWPFSNQYEYSPNYADFGHSESNAEFFRQMDYLTPDTFRVLKPGRIYALHVKDRIIPAGITGLGFQTTYPFHIDCIQHMVKHGFAYMGMKTIVTDVVRENNQTYRLGWSEQCKDGSKMGVGMPEYLLLFRKPPTDTSNAYADEPVLKRKPVMVTPEGNLIPYDRDLKFPIKLESGYSIAKWQVDAHGFTRSSGDRLIDPEDLWSLKADEVFKLYKKHSLEEVYNFEHHVRVGELLEQKGKLPPSFMLLQPQSWSDEVWTDITRMLTLNGKQWSKGKEMHLCPMQFDIVKRVITQMSNEGDIVYDPFGGLMTVPYWSILLKRFGMACELNPSYFLDGASHCQAATQQVGIPSLFDLLENRA
ncbi:DNA methylase N-4 [Taibaiella lutea]|uniref:DNA methylase N-4 n=1 Tax=Taibaiella lutea TaxID=2608001 RepID=A0A5M6CC24_9BACT|nr:DNA methyltransferase [Taibaiella lutea]KAA5532686.1 DNA methylase N-4 [Taibaiella lutea]